MDSFSQTEPLDFLLEVERLYHALLQLRPHAATAGLGGALFFGGALNHESRASIVAANIAGAATLTVSTDAAMQRRAIQDGVCDVLVNSLDEALRILKIEIRKQKQTSICLAQHLEDVLAEMRERGVVADISSEDFAQHSFRDDAAQDANLLIWRTDGTMQSLAELDRIALECIVQDDFAGRRWLQLSPRFMSRDVRKLRVLRCESNTAELIQARWKQEIQNGSVASNCAMQWTRNGQRTRAWNRIE